MIRLELWSVLQPPVPWTEAERPGPWQVICSDDAGETWRVVATCADDADADMIAAGMQWVADQRHAEREAEQARLMAEHHPG